MLRLCSKQGPRWCEKVCRSGEFEKSRSSAPACSERVSSDEERNRGGGDDQGMIRCGDGGGDVRDDGDESTWDEDDDELQR